jgi:hypothetical protein
MCIFSSNCRVEICMVISSKIIEFPLPYVTPCSCRVLEKLVGPQQVMKFPPCVELENFIIVFTRTHYWTLPLAISVQLMPTYQICLILF